MICLLLAVDQTNLLVAETAASVDRKVDFKKDAPPNSGQSWPEQAEASKATHWSFQAIVRPAIPRVKKSRWVRNPIDSFVLSKLEGENFSASPEASRRQLIRRLKFDLLGLPPTPEEVDGFLNNKRPNAYEQLVDQYLASPHFGERWGRHWLDVARYADSAGYEADLPRRAWYYRDWAINALNHDMPFDQFVVQQIAGDLMPEARLDTHIATAFHANNALDNGQPWESILERVNTTGVALLGLTVGCAQCHNHKTDPISTREYYQLYAFFNNAEVTNLDLLTPKEIEKRGELQAKLEHLTNDLAALEMQLTNDTSLVEWEMTLKQEERAKLPVTAQQLFMIPPDQRSEEDKNTLARARLATDRKRGELLKKSGDLKTQLVNLPMVPVLKEKPKETHIFIRGNPEHEGEVVQPAVPVFLPPIRNKSPLTRLDLAHWIVGRENPLTARVMVNRIWMRYFGQGLVETENDFGVQTPAPTHRELLDWLASEFIERKWSLKAIHRLIVGSSTYRQSSQRQPGLATKDPSNRLLGRQQRLRLEAEIIRDASLAVSGLLSTKIGGPGVFPYQAPGVLEMRATKAEWLMSEGEDRYRRGIYTWFWRLTPHPFPALFDAPDANTACTRRNHSNTPLQALTLLNDPTFVECAKALARRVLKQNPSDPAAGVRSMVKLCLGREPNPQERQLLSDLVSEQARHFSGALVEAKKMAGADSPAKFNVAQYAAWIVASRAVLNLDEFITRE